MQQATVNLLSDMGAQPGRLQAGLVPGGPLDATAPTATITDPARRRDRARRHRRRSPAPRPTPAAWSPRSRSRPTAGRPGAARPGTTSWTYTFNASTGPGDRAGRAVDDAANIGAAASVNFDVGPQACPCSIFAPAVTGTEDNDNSAVELGVKFRSDVAGFITGIRFYKTSGNTGTHTGTLWSTAGSNLATVTFTGESGERLAGGDLRRARRHRRRHHLRRVVPHHRPASYAIGTSFATAGVDNPPLHALQDGVDGANGVYRYGGGGVVPDEHVRVVELPRRRRLRGRRRARRRPRRPSSRAPRLPDATGGRRGRQRDGHVQRADGGGLDQRQRPSSCATPPSAVVGATVVYDAGTRTAILDPDAAARLQHDLHGHRAGRRRRRHRRPPATRSPPTSPGRSRRPRRRRHRRTRARADRSSSSPRRPTRSAATTSRSSATRASTPSTRSTSRTRHAGDAGRLRRRRARRDPDRRRPRRRCSRRGSPTAGNLIAMRPDPDLAGLRRPHRRRHRPRRRVPPDRHRRRHAGRRPRRPDDPVPRHRRPLRPRRGHRRPRHAVLDASTATTNPAVTAAQRRLERRPGGRLRLRPRALRRLHAPGQPGLGRHGARRRAAPDHPLRRPVLPGLDRLLARSRSRRPTSSSGCWPTSSST